MGNRLPCLVGLSLLHGVAAANVGDVQAVERGAWFWYQSSDPHGAANVVGNAAAEDEAIDYLQHWNVTRLYGSYANLPAASPGALAAWNKKLAQAGIQSFVVLSDANGILPGNQPNLLSLVDARLVNFNNGRIDPLEHFVGVEMDLEPHTLSQWDAGTAADRRDLLLYLRDAFAAVRQRAAEGGWAYSTLSAALPVWFDSSSSIGWTDSAERDQWFADVGVSLDAISLMAYETSSVTSVMSSTAYERAEFAGDVHVALRSKLGAEWATFSDFASAMGSLETQLNAGIDVESYYRLRQIASISADFDGDGDSDGADLLAWQRGAGTATGAAHAMGDANGDGDVDVADLRSWRAEFTSGSASSAASAIPEPRGSALAAITAAMLGASHAAAKRRARQ